MVDPNEVNELIDALCNDYEIDPNEIQAVFEDKLFKVAEGLNADPDTCEYTSATLSWICFRLGYIVGIVRERTGTLP